MTKIINKFKKNTSGNFAMMFALALLPLMMGVGAAVDYSSVSNDRTKVQNSMDAAVLAASKEMNSLSNGELKKRVREHLEANLDPQLFAVLKKAKIQIDRKSGTITGTVDGNMKTSFMQLAGLKTLDYNVTSVVRGPDGAAEIALVLDNTYSMSADGKMDSLKAAANGFINNLIDDDGDSGTKIGIVPFSNHVNVGLDNRGASWLSVEDDSETTEDVCYMKKDILSSFNCETKIGYNDGIPYEYESCEHTYGEEYEVCEPKTTTAEWKGCVGSRSGTLSLEDRAYNTEKVPGLMNTWCGKEILALTDDKDELSDKVDSMSPTQDTYIPAGLSWGMRILSKKAPYKEAVTADNKIRKYLVLMTDGDNQRSANLPHSPGNWGNDIDQANDWTLQVCGNIKDEDIHVYTVSFGTLTDETKDLLKDCASNEDSYFHAATGTELDDAFDEISKNISKMHLSM